MLLCYYFLELLFNSVCVELQVIFRTEYIKEFITPIIVQQLNLIICLKDILNHPFFCMCNIYITVLF